MSSYLSERFAAEKIKETIGAFSYHTDTSLLLSLQTHQPNFRKVVGTSTTFSQFYRISILPRTKKKVNLTRYRFFNNITSRDFRFHS